jgi:hypothetical protein
MERDSLPITEQTGGPGCYHRHVNQYCDLSNPDSATEWQPCQTTSCRQLHSLYDIYDVYVKATPHQPYSSVAERRLLGM